VSTNFTTSASDIGILLLKRGDSVKDFPSAYTNLKQILGLTTGYSIKEWSDEYEMNTEGYCEQRKIEKIM